MNSAKVPHFLIGIECSGAPSEEKEKIRPNSPCLCVSDSITTFMCVCFPLCEKRLPRTKGMDQTISSDTLLNIKVKKQKMMEHTMDILISCYNIYKTMSQQ